MGLHKWQPCIIFWFYLLIFDPLWFLFVLSESFFVSLICFPSLVCESSRFKRLWDLSSFCMAKYNIMPVNDIWESMQKLTGIRGVLTFVLWYMSHLLMRCVCYGSVERNVLLLKRPSKQLLDYAKQKVKKNKNSRTWCTRVINSIVFEPILSVKRFGGTIQKTVNTNLLVIMN